jgi:prolyl 4-hydroxylase
MLQAYVPHEDYLTNDSNENYDYDSSRIGGNRYATILLYMSQVESGGETVFEKAWPVGATDQHKTKPIKDTIRELRESGQIDLLTEGSWEESLAAKCRTRLVVEPKPGRAVLFYSQHPNGTVDKASLHGACPVLQGTKV